MRFSRKSQLAKLGSMSTFRSVNCSEEGGVPDPSDGDLPGGQFGKGRALGLAGAPGQQRLPDHLAKERARVEVLGRR